MKRITSDMFVDVLINSTLDENEQKIIVKMLPQMTKEQISDLYKILVNDVDRLEKIIADFNSDIDRLSLKAEVEFKNIELKK